MTVVFKNSGPLPRENCGICLEKLKEDVFGHDGHFFHGRCVKPWLAEHQTCPLCRAKVKDSTWLNRHILFVLGQSAIITPVAWQVNRMINDSSLNLLEHGIILAVITMVWMVFSVGLIACCCHR